MTQQDLKIGIIGGGSFATALIKVFEENTMPKNKINWYIRKKDIITDIKENGRNKRYLSSVRLNMEKINLSDDINEVARNSNILILAIPSAYLVDAMSNLTIDISNKFILSAIKGIIPETNLIISNYMNQEYNVPIENIGTFSGPCHAEEIALERLSYLTLSSKNIEIIRKLSFFMECGFLKISLSNDMHGTEYASVLKNIYAIATGICHSLGYGDNFQAVLISSALQETKDFVSAIDPKSRNVKDSSYLGDLLVTTYSQFSRNRAFGAMLGKGYPVKASLLELGMIAEGYYASKSINQINKEYKIPMPIAEAVHNIIYANVSPAIEIKLLTNYIK